MKKIFVFLFGLALALGMFAGCGLKESPNDINANENATDQTADDSEPVKVDFSKTEADMFTERDNNIKYDDSTAVTVELNDKKSVASSDSVKISGSIVTITEEATYIISGELSDGMLIVNAPDTAKLQLVFNGVTVTSKTSAALYVLEADKVFVTLAEGSTNTLANGGSFVAIDDNNIDAALFSKQDLTLNGTGSLTVTSPVGHGIVCKDDLVITGGSYTINSAFHGVDANDSVRIANAVLTIDAGKDAIHSENNDDASRGFVYMASGTVQAEAEGDGISAGAYLQIAGGTIDLLVGGGSENGSKKQSDSFGGFMGGGKPRYADPSATETDGGNGTSMKGLKAANSLLVSGGTITINSADDSLHSNVSVFINGGTFTLASGDDAIHAEEELTVTAGNIDISESYEGLEALHILVQGGDIKLVARDDGLNAAGGTDQNGTTGGRDGMFGGGMGGGHGGMSARSNGSIRISDGTLYIRASGDGIDANGTVEISGGQTTVVGPTQGDTATLDYDTSAVITGGTFMGTGASGMAQTFSSSEQGVVAVRVGNQSAGTPIVLKNAKGDTLITHTPELDFAVLILSSPELVKGETYSVVVGSESGEFEAN